MEILLQCNVTLYSTWNVWLYNLIWKISYLNFLLKLIKGWKICCWFAINYIFFQIVDVKQWTVHFVKLSRIRKVIYYNLARKKLANRFKSCHTRTWYIKCYSFKSFISLTINYFPFATYFPLINIVVLLAHAHHVYLFLMSSVLYAFSVVRSSVH